LPQGDAMSPLLWNIFYDTLLCRLQKDSVGVKIDKNKPLKITSIAFADDLIPMSRNAEDLQNQLTIIYKFLDMHSMNMGPDKSKIITNLSEAETNIVKEKQIHLNNKPIKYVLDKSQITRFLGVYLSLDSNREKTINDAKKKFMASIIKIQNKYTPGTISAYILNTVIIARLKYHLQITPTTMEDFKFFNSYLKRTLKNDNNFNSTINDAILYDKEIGLGLQDIEIVITKQCIDNHLILEQVAGIPGQIHTQTLDYFQRELNMPHNLTVIPIRLPKELRLKYNVCYLSSVLLKNETQFRSISISNDKQDIALNMNPKEYNKHWKTLVTRNIKLISDLTTDRKRT
jgi:hypothetical protein